MGLGKRLLKHRYFRLFLCISLALHMLGVVLFLAHSFKKHAAAFFLPAKQQSRRAFLVNTNHVPRKKFVLPPKTTPHKPLQLPPKRVAKLTAPRSQFGWVFFDEPPIKQADNKPIEAGIPTNTDGDVLTVKRAYATEDKAKAVKGIKPKASLVTAPTAAKKVQEPVRNTQAAATKDPSKPTKPTQIVAQAQTAKAPELVLKKEAKASIIAPEKPTQIASIEERIERIKSLQNKLAQQNNEPVSSTNDVTTPITTNHPSCNPQTSTDQQAATTSKEQATTIAQEGEAEGANGTRVRGANCDGKQPTKRNLIALTKGFIEKLDGEDGTDPVDRDGDANIKASFEEMQYLSYEAKITWTLQASWKQNFSYRYSNRQIPEGDAVIEFTLDEHGNLLNSTLLQSSGYPELDTMIMKNMKFASPFPPLPHHFGTKQYTTGRIIQVRSHRFSF